MKPGLLNQMAAGVEMAEQSIDFCKNGFVGS